MNRKDRHIANVKAETGLSILFPVFYVIVSFSSCAKNKQWDDAVKIVSEWIGKELKIIFSNYGFFHPVFIDKENSTDKINKFPSNPLYQCFLFDKINKVVLAGNPSLNSGIWTLFKRVITEREKRVLIMEKGEVFNSLQEKITLQSDPVLIKKGGHHEMI